MLDNNYKTANQRGFRTVQQSVYLGKLIMQRYYRQMLEIKLKLKEVI